MVPPSNCSLALPHCVNTPYADVTVSGGGGGGGGGDRNQIHARHVFLCTTILVSTHLCFMSLHKCVELLPRLQPRYYSAVRYVELTYVVIDLQVLCVHACTYPCAHTHTHTCARTYTRTPMARCSLFSRLSCPVPPPQLTPTGSTHCQDCLQRYSAAQEGVVNNRGEVGTWGGAYSYVREEEWGGAHTCHYHGSRPQTL